MKKLIIAVLLVCSAAVANAQWGKNFIDQNYIEVAGYNKTEVTPDMIFINFQINEADTKGKVSVDKMEKDIISSLQRLGIDVQKKLTINDMSNSMKKYLLKKQDVMNSKEYILEVNSAAMASRVFGEFDKAGIANASVQRIDHSDIDNLRIESRAEAVQNARAKATALAGAVGQTAGKALYIQDVERTYRPAYNSMMVKSIAYDSAAGGGASEPSLEFEKINIESNVTVYFILE